MPRFRFKTPVFSRLCGFCQLFPLDRGGGLAGDVVDHAADALYLVGDAGSNAAEELMAEGRVFAGHEVRRAHGAEGEDIAVIAKVPDDADAARVRADRQRGQGRQPCAL